MGNAFYNLRLALFHNDAFSLSPPSYKYRGNNRIILQCGHIGSIHDKGLTFWLRCHEFLDLSRGLHKYRNHVFSLSLLVVDVENNDYLRFKTFLRYIFDNTGPDQWSKPLTQ